MTRILLNLTIVMAMAFTSMGSTQQDTEGNKSGTKIEELQPAPAFTVQDVYGATIDLASLKGKKVMLTLYRNVGCAVCNLRFHELEEQAAYFESRDLVLLAVYESTAENMLRYLDNQRVYPKMIPDPELKLYKLYGLEKSPGKMMKGMLRGGLKKRKEGKKLFHEKIKKDGSAARISADFLIDEGGIVRKAYYGKYVGDHLPVDAIKQFIE